MMSLYNGQIKAAAVFGQWEVDAVLVNILPFQGKRFSLTKSCIQNEFKESFVNGVKETLNSSVPSREIFNGPAVGSILVPFDRVRRTLRKIISSPGMVPNCTK
jgi:hypothetical protein